MSLRLMSVRDDETSIHISILKWLRLVLPKSIVYHTPNGQRRSKSERAQFKRLGGSAGIPDLTILTSDGRALFCEIKTRRGCLTPEQREFRDFCIAARIPHAVVRSIDETRDFLAESNVMTREASL